MLCEVCKEREAMVHLNTTRELEVEEGVDPESVDVEAVMKEAGITERHFCEECADKYFASTPGMNSSRSLICLSDGYRRKLLDKVEAELPEAFYDGEESKRMREVSEKMMEFLKRELEREGIPVERDAFLMLWSDLFCGAEFYERRDRFNGGVSE
jgi:hypothetical protein